ISYKREDRPRVLPLVRVLEAASLSVWWDALIVPGARYPIVLKAELDAAGCMLVVCTQSSVTASGDYATDWMEVETLEWRKKTKPLVPVLLDDVLVPFIHQNRQQFDLVGWTGEPGDPRLVDLMDALAPHAPRDGGPQHPIPL